MTTLKALILVVALLLTALLGLLLTGGRNDRAAVQTDGGPVIAAQQAILPSEQEIWDRVRAEARSQTAQSAQPRESWPMPRANDLMLVRHDDGPAHSGNGSQIAPQPPGPSAGPADAAAALGNGATAAEDEDDFVAEPADPMLAFESMNLDRMTLDEVVLHYDPALVEQINAVRQALDNHLSFEMAELQRSERLQQRADDVVAELAQIIGIDPAQHDMDEYREILLEAIDMTPRLIDAPGRLNILVLSQATVKDQLREGASLPGFDYDAEDDEASYHFGVIIGGSQDEPISVFPLPVDADQPIAPQLHSFLYAMRVPQRAIYGAALHEVAQLMMIDRLEPDDPYHRWFTEGFATVIALHVVEQHVGEEAADAFRPDSSQYRDLQNETNLYYWMDSGYEVATPLEDEGRLAAARYAFAVDEARFIVGRFNLEIVGRILDRAATLEPRAEMRRLDAAIANETGINIAERFRRFQRFATADDGIERYARQSNAALEREDYAAMLPNVLRIKELRGEYDIEAYSNAAFLLYAMGYDELGDAVFDKQLALLEATSMNDRLHAMRLRHLQYAMQTDAPYIAYLTAEQVLERDADHVPALTFRLHRLIEEEAWPEARQIAQRIVELDTTPGGSPYTELAREAIAEIDAMRENAP